MILWKIWIKVMGNVGLERKTVFCVEYRKELQEALCVLFKNMRMSYSSHYNLP